VLFLLFALGSDRYALPARDVTEVLPLVALKEIPGAPNGIAGLMDYRGTPVPVVDLNALALGRPAARRVSTRLLIVRYTAPSGGERALGLLAEHATEMTTRAPEDFKPAGVDGAETRYLGPVASDPRGLIQRVDVAELLNDELRAVLFTAGEQIPAT
jgi:chemotaxis-related protein WspB